MEKSRGMWVGGTLAVVLGLMMPVSAWAAWGMKDEPKDQAAPAAPADFKGIEELAKEDPNFATDLYRMAADRYLNRGKPAQAVAMYAEAMKLTPNNTSLMEGLADAERAAGQKKEALATWEGILSSGHNDIGFQLRYANFLEKIGEFSKSIEIVRAQAATRPDDSSLHYGIADAYQRQGKPSEAVKELQAMLKAFPKEETEIKRRIAGMQPAPPAPAPKQEAPPPAHKKKQPPVQVKVEAPSPVEVKAEVPVAQPAESGQVEGEKKP